MPKKYNSKGFIRWIGGKRSLRKTIAPLIPDDIQSYIEPFGGAAWVMFYKEKWADLEVYNDLDGRLVNLFRIVKYHPQAFKDELKYLLGSREIFFQFMNGTFITDIQKAAQFYFIVTRSFAGKCEAIGLTRKYQGGICKSQKNSIEKIDDIHSRLDKVVIENLDFEELIKYYDFENAFFYCDPPYSQGYKYGIQKQKFEHKRLFNVLKDIKGRFLLSYNDSPEIRELYKDFEIIEIERLNSMNNKTVGGHIKEIYKELLIANYPIELCQKNQ